ncbi:MAG: glycosyltransferase family 4 protein [Acidobacteria bacterium]|nr:glycosyltransferase family 4 protein [Acidobacteriota bacterium]
MISSRSLSILHVHTLPILSGSGINTLLTMQGSRDRGYQVALVCASMGRLTQQAEEMGIAVHLAPQLNREIHVLNDMQAVFALQRLMRRNRFDVVHTHNSKAGFVGRLAARLAGIPLVAHTVHGFAFHDAEYAFRRGLFLCLERLAAHWCDGMIFISKSLLDWAERERIGRGVPKAVIYSGIDVTAFKTADGSQFRKEWGILPQQLAVGMVSKLWEGKGHDVLLRAWKGVLENLQMEPKPVLLIVGEGHLEAALRSRMSQLRLQGSVIFTGFRTDIPAVTAAIDIAVLPSLFEGMGRVVLEAMAAGKPIVASNTGGIPDLVQHGTNGLLVEAGDPEALKRALLEVLSTPTLRRRLAEGSRVGVRREYTASYMVEQIHQFYEEVQSVKYRGNRRMADISRGAE